MSKPPQIRLPHPPVRKNIDQAEARKRQIGFALPPRTILVKTYGVGPIEELPLQERNRAAVEAQQIEEGDRRGLQAFAQRPDRPDHGFPVFQKERCVSLRAIVGELLAAGYVYAGGHRYVDRDRDGKVAKGDVNVMVFERPRDGIVGVPVPAFVREALDATFNNVSVWVNLKVPEGGQRYRLDTIDAAAYSEVGTAEILHLHGQSYRREVVADADDLIRDALARAAEARRTAAE